VPQRCQWVTGVGQEVWSRNTDGSRQKGRANRGRPSKADPFRWCLVAERDQEPAALAVELLRRARQAGYGGAKSALCALVKELRPDRPRPLVRFEGLPGDCSQHAFGAAI